MTFTASLRSELLKTKRTSLLYLVLIAALIVPLVLSFDLATSQDIATKNGWSDFYNEGLMVLVFAFIPLFFILASTVLMQIEVRNNTWKQVLASPQPFIHMLLAKFVVLQLTVLAFIVVSNIYFILGAGIVDMAMGTNISSFLDRWPEMLSVNCRAYVATLGISGAMFWIALRSRNAVSPLGIGLLLWLAPVVALEFKWAYVDMYVFALPFTVLATKFKDEQLFHQLLSVGYGVVLFTGAYLEFLLKRTSFRKIVRRKEELVGEDVLVKG